MIDHSFFETCGTPHVSARRPLFRLSRCEGVVHPAFLFSPSHTMPPRRAIRLSMQENGSFVFIQGHFVRSLGDVSHSSRSNRVFLFPSPSKTASGASKTAATAIGFSGPRLVSAASFWGTTTAATATCMSGKSSVLAVVRLWSQQIPVRSFPMSVVIHLNLFAAAHQLALFDSYAAGVPGLFRAVSAFSLTLLNNEDIRSHAQACTDIRDLHLLIRDCVSLNRPPRLIAIMRERLDLLLTSLSITLPPSMLE